MVSARRIGDLRGAGAEVGETRVVDVQAGETRVVDVQLGESRIADVRPGEARVAPARQAPSTTLDTRSEWDAVTVTVETPADRTPSARRGAADPVKALMHRHRQLCERAVDPLEIAAGLEAHGLTDRTATHFRHRDVFSLAEEMYARAPRAEDRAEDTEGPENTGSTRRTGNTASTGSTGSAGSTGSTEGAASRSEAPDPLRARADWAVLALLPGSLCAAAVAGLRYTEGRPRLAVTVVGVLAVALGLRAALSRGPLHATWACSPTPSTRAWTCWLVAYALLGDGLLAAGIEGGPDGLPTGGSDSPWPIALTSVLALAAACAPAAWCAHLFAVRARRRLATSRALEEFATSVKPLLLGVFGLFLGALGGLLALSGAVLDEPVAYAGAGALGALLLLARLLTVHGFTHAPALVVAAAGVVETAALLSVYAGRLPGGRALARPVETVTDAWGTGAVPALVCGSAALVLLLHATRTLTRASAHAARGATP